jgi:cell division protease FtsH
MVAKYGMSDLIGPVAIDVTGNKLSYSGSYMPDRPTSEEVAGKVDGEVSRIMHEALTRVEQTLNNHREALEGMSKELMEVETIEREDFEKLLILYGIKPKKRTVDEDPLDIEPKLVV